MAFSPGERLAGSIQKGKNASQYPCDSEFVRTDPVRFVSEGDSRALQQILDPGCVAGPAPPNQAESSGTQGRLPSERQRRGPGRSASPMLLVGWESMRSET
jgi:hypothetical protein